MKILAGYYTHNRLRPKLLEESLKSYIKSINNPNVIPIVSSWEPIPNIPCTNILSKFKNNGHMNILLQLYSIIYSCDKEWDFFAFCEHDCLYPNDYFTNAFKILNEGKYTGIASENHIGMRPSGYCDLKTTPQPLSTMIVSRNQLMDALQIKFRECVIKGGCCIEPDNRSNWYIQRRSDASIPVIHVNMDATINNHHLTNHYDCYKSSAFASAIPYWGDYKQYGIFSDSEILHSISTSIKVGTVQIIDAIYGIIENGKTVSFMEPLRKLQLGKRVVANNQTAGNDPAVGLIKKLRIKYVDGGKTIIKDFTEGDTVTL